MTLLWMWITGLVGMAAKYSEAVPGVRCGEAGADGRSTPGPDAATAAG